MTQKKQAQGQKLAIVTGASSGIGFELARLCAEHGYDLVIAADEPEIQEAATALRGLGVQVEALHVDLAQLDGVDRLYAAAGGRPVDALLANAGRGLGDLFLKQDFREVRHVIDTNITGTIYLVQKVLRDMVGRNAGKVLITGSVAGHMPGPFHAVYHGTKAFIDSFAASLRNELKDTEVTLTCLQPGPTDTEFFARAGLEDTKMAQAAKNYDPADVAKAGFEAMLKGEGTIVTGLMNKVQVVMGEILPTGMVAETSRKLNEPGGAS
jgi:short-subunit dehydrogenase